MESAQPPSRKVRIARAIDDEVKAFEKSLAERVRARPYEKESPQPVELNLFQSSLWHEKSGGDFRIIQVWGADGNPAAQVTAVINRPRGFSWFAQAVVPSWSCAWVDHEEEYWLLKNLPSLLCQSDNLVKIRLHAYRPEYQDLMDFVFLAQRAGYRVVPPEVVTRTALYDLRFPVEELLTAFDKKTRAKIRHAGGLASVDIRVLNDPVWIPQMAAALNASFSRTSGGSGHFDFATAFKVARDHPGRMLVFGLFLKDRPEQLLAYLIAARHGRVVEALSSGSLPDPELRKFPFNYFLHWETILWAHQHGAELLDLGGITDGGESDPLAGISSFKRHFTRLEREVGREFELELAPARLAVYRLIKRLTG